jgi:hypothetical protein
VGVGWAALGVVVTALMWRARPQALRNAERIYVEDELARPAAPIHYGEEPGVT